MADNEEPMQTFTSGQIGTAFDLDPTLLQNVMRRSYLRLDAGERGQWRRYSLLDAAKIGITAEFVRRLGIKFGVAGVAVGGGNGRMDLAELLRQIEAVTWDKALAADGVLTTAGVFFAAWVQNLSDLAGEGAEGIGRVVTSQGLVNGMNDPANDGRPAAVLPLLPILRRLHALTKGDIGE